MSQLIIYGSDGPIYVPRTSRDRYRAYEDRLSVRLEMISGRIVEEMRGKVWKIEYSADYIEPTIYVPLLQMLRSGKTLNVAFLNDETVSAAAAYKTGRFRVEKIDQPYFAFARGGKPYWHRLGFVLREESPHD